MIGDREGDPDRRALRRRRGRDHDDEPKHGRAHNHGHGHNHRHGHTVSAGADRRLLGAALALILAFMVGEVVIGYLAGSLALITDAAHMMTDAFAIALALVAMRIAARPPKGGFTYGLRRAEILSAQLNGLTLILLTAYFVYEGVRRLIEPHPVEGQFVFWTAMVGIAVNVAATWLISRADRSSLNIEGAFQHILNDLFAFIATAIAGLVVWTTGFNRADALASLLVAALMLKAGYGLLRDAGRVLMEAAPAGIDPSELGTRLAGRPCVEEVHDLHVWEVSSGYTALSAHVLVDTGGDCHAVRRDLQELLRTSYGITHTTLEVDHVGEPSGDGDDHCYDPHGPRHVGDARTPHQHAGPAPCDH